MKQAEEDAVWVSGFLLACSLAVLVALTFYLNHGFFTYSIDDPYIHLDLADTLWRTGVYGVNPADGPASPSSSPLWPFLLAPFSDFSWQYLVPLFINITCSLLALPVLQQILLRIYARWNFSPRLAIQVLLLLASVLGLNLVPLIFSGLEHNLQVLLALLVALATLKLIEENRVPPWLWPMLIVGPLIRYENLALSLVTLTFFTIWRARMLSMITGALIATTLGGFTLFLVGLGLDPLPNSVVVRKYLSSNPLAAASFELSQGLASSLAIYAMLIVIGAVSLWLLFHARQWRQVNNLGLLAVLAVLGLHLAAGKFGPPGFNRYEIYAIAYVWPVLLYTGRDMLRALGQDRLTRSLIACVLAAGVLLNPILLYANTVRCAHAIYLQQAQMHDFIINVWKAPVAVNDIGLTGYKNPYYVLDMWGLASVEARNIHWYGKPGAFSALVQKRHVDMAMLYPGWFTKGELLSWIPVGVLHRKSGIAAHGAADVTIYATHPEAVMRVQNSLQLWAKRLPDGAEIRLIKADTAQP